MAIIRVAGLSPDGFGGKVCKSKVKAIPARILQGDGSPPPPPPPPRQAKAAAPVAATRSSSSTPALTFDELLANSITQKEGFLGRPMTDDEKSNLSEKLKSLMGQ